MTLIVCVIPMFTGELVGVNSQGDIDEDEKPFDNWILATCFTILKYLIMIGLYIGAIVIIYGTINYVPEKHLQVHGELPPVSPAVACTMILASQFFIVYAGMQFARTWTQFTLKLKLPNQLNTLRLPRLPERLVIQSQPTSTPSKKKSPKSLFQLKKSSLLKQLD